MGVSTADDFGPPPDYFARARWIRPRDAKWAEDCNRILLEHGAVTGRTIYERREQARWRARRLIRLLVELRLHERWHLTEHVFRDSSGWKWTVEYKGGGRDGRAGHAG
jgi:hypothetical protein